MEFLSLTPLDNREESQETREAIRVNCVWCARLLLTREAESLSERVRELSPRSLFSEFIDSYLRWRDRGVFPRSFGKGGGETMRRPVDVVNAPSMYDLDVLVLNLFRRVAREGEGNAAATASSGAQEKRLGVSSSRLATSSSRNAMPRNGTSRDGATSPLLSAKRVMQLCGIFHEPNRRGNEESTLREIFESSSSSDFENDMAREFEQHSLDPSAESRTLANLRAVLELSLPRRPEFARRLFKCLGGVRGTEAEALGTVMRWYSRLSSPSHDSSTAASEERDDDEETRAVSLGHLITLVRIGLIETVGKTEEFEATFACIMHLHEEDSVMGMNFLGDLARSGMRFNNALGACYQDNKFGAVKDVARIKREEEARIEYLDALTSSPSSVSSSTLVPSLVETRVRWIEEVPFAPSTTPSSRELDDDAEHHGNHANEDAAAIGTNYKALLDIFPDLDEGLATRLLDYNEGNLDRASAMILEGNIPDALLESSREHAKQPSPRAYRKGVFEDDDDDDARFMQGDDALDKETKTRLARIYEAYGDDEYDESLDDDGKFVLDVGVGDEKVKTKRDVEEEEEEENGEDERSRRGQNNPIQRPPSQQPHHPQRPSRRGNLVPSQIPTAAATSSSSSARRGGGHLATSTNRPPAATVVVPKYTPRENVVVDADGTLRDRISGKKVEVDPLARANPNREPPTTLPLAPRSDLPVERPTKESGGDEEEEEEEEHVGRTAPPDGREKRDRAYADRNKARLANHNRKARSLKKSAF